MPESFFTQLINQLTGLRLQVWNLVKIAILIGLFFYIGFSVMIVRQVGLMGRSLNGKSQGPLKTIAWLYFLATIIVFLLAMILL
ncbi:MAG TPA: DUF5657 family protein [Candidatus Bathyarchaeia archaeon]|nr:DUF5657 family protein [Candidatus Bathyarchaeia archaeon]